MRVKEGKSIQVTEEFLTIKRVGINANTSLRAPRVHMEGMEVLFVPVREMEKT